MGLPAVWCSHWLRPINGVQPSLFRASSLAPLADPESATTEPNTGSGTCQGESRGLSSLLAETIAVPVTREVRTLRIRVDGGCESTVDFGASSHPIS